jgi:surface carbohydrate biosynthesis protein (TIGR04326 family)
VPDNFEDDGGGLDILIWDQDSVAPAGNWEVVLWQGYQTFGKSRVVSIPKIIEEDAERLRCQYLAWIWDLGHTQISGRRVVDRLVIRPGLSYWWMTLLAQKCNYSKSPNINEAIKLIAFAEWISTLAQPIKRIRVVSASQGLIKCLQLWATDQDIPMVLQGVSDAVVKRGFFAGFFERLPQLLQALIWLPAHLLAFWPLKGVGLNAWKKTVGRITFFSYLFNLSSNALEHGQYEASYWSSLPTVLSDAGKDTNWLHWYNKHEALPTARRAAELLRTFNKTSNGGQCHVTPHTFLSTTVLVRTLYDWGRLLISGIGTAHKLAKVPALGFPLWPLFENDWRKSRYGIEALSTILNFNLIESAIQSLPKQEDGVYLQENQPWEFGLIHAWQTSNHGRLIGVPHSTVRFWDLRYFFDAKSYVRTGHNDLPLPTLVAMNGNNMASAYEAGGYPKGALIKLEALRYIYLTVMPKRVTKIQDTSAKSKRSMRLLVVCDILSLNTQRQLTLLSAALPLMPDVRIIVKPHPASLVDPLDYPELSMTLTTRPLSELLLECDAVYSSNMTSAAVDAYYARVPVISSLDPRGLNFSPLRGYSGVLFVTTPQELVAGLDAIDPWSQATTNEIDFFFLSRSLAQWENLLIKKALSNSPAESV